MRKTYLRYPGGKSKYARYIFPVIKDFQEYREPMIGGGSVFLYIKNKFPDKNYWINDKYSNLYFFWIACRDNNKNLIKELLKIKQSTSVETASDRFKDIRNKIESADEFWKSVYFYYLNKCSFSGLTENGTCSTQAWSQNFSEKSIKSLSDLEDILRGVKITNLHYKDVIGCEGDNVFIYLDPPYDIGKQNVLYGRDGNIHREFDHMEFFDDINRCRHNLLISYNDSETLRERFKDYYIDTLSFRYTMRQSKTEGGLVSKEKTELLIRNYE